MFHCCNACIHRYSGFCTIYDSCIDDNNLCVYKQLGKKKVNAMLNTLEPFGNDNCIFIFFEVGQ